MREIVVAVFGAWDAEVQWQFHKEWFDPDRVQVLEVAGSAVGVLDVQEHEDHVYLARLEVLPEMQNRGVGTSVVGGLLGSAKVVRLRVLTVNVRARALYERLGFIVNDEHDGRIGMVFRAQGDVRRG